MEKMIKDFNKFLNEASLQDNQAIPDDYLREVERKAQVMLRERGINQRTINQFMGMIQEVQRIQRGHEEALEELAENIIRQYYGTIIENVTLDIKIVRPGQVPTEGTEEEPSDEQPPEMEEVTDDDLKMEVDKRKIANNIMQGEAKNTHRIIHMDECKDGLDGIDARLFDLYDNILKVNEVFDWTVPMEVQLAMWKQRPEGFAGNVKVDWGKKEEEDAELAEKVLKGLEEGDDIKDQEEETEELFNSGEPKITVRGIDFCMLIHETVKGIYELIAAAGIPENEELAKFVILNADTLSYEIEDLRYGPFIASDLRDFINENRESTRYPNIREHVFGKMITLPADEFIALMKGILSKSDEARTKIDELIAEVIQDISQYEEEQKGWEMEQRFGPKNDDSDDEHEEDHHEEDGEEGTLKPGGKEEESEIDKIIKQSSQKKEPKGVENMSQNEIKKLIDDALDNGDYDEVGRLSKYLKEGYMLSEMKVSLFSRVLEVARLYDPESEIEYSHEGIEITGDFSEMTEEDEDELRDLGCQVLARTIIIENV